MTFSPPPDLPPPDTPQSDAPQSDAPLPDLPRRYLKSHAARTLMVRLIQVMFPHDTVPDSAYERTADILLMLATRSNRSLLAVSRGLASLDYLASVEHLSPLGDRETSANLATPANPETSANPANPTEPDANFLTLPPDAATQALHTIEHTEFFTFVRDNAVLTLYSLPEVWQALGYEGASGTTSGSTVSDSTVSDSTVSDSTVSGSAASGGDASGGTASGIDEVTL